MTYDTKVIYGDTNSDYNSFQLNGMTYYTTKTGITKRCENGIRSNAERITEFEYNKAWEQYTFLFN